MPGQVFQVVQCYSCRTFQVQQKKKVNKWVCKMCGEKQSIKKIYGEGSGADCRVHVQKLNTLRGEMDSMDNTWTSDVSRRKMDSPLMGCVEMDQHRPSTQDQHNNQNASCWDQYVDEGDEDGEEEDLGTDERWTTDRQVYRKSLNDSRKRKCRKKTKQRREAFIRKSQSIFKSYTLQRDDSSMPSRTPSGPWDETCTPYNDDYRAGILTGENQHTTWHGNQLIHNQQQHDKTWQDKLVVSDISSGGSVDMRNNTGCETSETRTVNMLGSCALKKLKSSCVVPAKTSKWSSFVEDNEESDDDSESENQIYPTNSIRVGGSFNSNSSFQPEPSNNPIESKWSVFETNEKPIYCPASESSVNSPVTDQTHRDVLKVNQTYLSVCVSSSPLRGTRDSEESRDRGDDRKAYSFTPNGQRVSASRQPAAALFTLGDLDEEDLNLDL